MTKLSVEQIVLGPVDDGRNFRELAASARLALPNEALDALRDFNHRIGKYIPAGGVAYAGFKLSEPPARDLWAVTASVERGRVKGNPIVLTRALVLTRPQLDLVEFRLARFIPEIPDIDGPPPVGATLDPVVVDVGAFNAYAPGAKVGPDANLKRLRDGVGVERLQLALGDDLDPTSTLVQLLQGVTRTQLMAASFSNTPAPIRAWDVSIFAADEWRAAPDAVAFGLAGLAGAGASPAVEAFAALLRSMESAPERGRMGAETLAAASPWVVPGENAKQAILRRGLALLLSLPDRARALWMQRLVRAAVHVPTADHGEDVRAGILGLLNELVRNSEDPAVLLNACGEADIADQLARIDAGPLTLARLSLERGAALRLKPEVLASLAEDLVARFPAALARAVGSDAVADPDNLITLLGVWRDTTPILPGHWRLGARLARRLADAANMQDFGEQRSTTLVARALIEDVMVKAERQGRCDALAILLGQGGVGALMRVLGRSRASSLIDDARQAFTAPLTVRGRAETLGAALPAFVMLARLRMLGATKAPAP